MKLAKSLPIFGASKPTTIIKTQQGVLCYFFSNNQMVNYPLQLLVLPMFNFKYKIHKTKKYVG